MTVAAIRLLPIPARSPPRWSTSSTRRSTAMTPRRGRARPPRASAGTATVTQVPTGSVSVTASADGLADPPAPDGHRDSAWDREHRVHHAACDRGDRRGSAAHVTRAGPLSAAPAITFRDASRRHRQQFQPGPGLTASAFTLEDCTAVSESPEHCSSRLRTLRQSRGSMRPIQWQRRHACRASSWWTRRAGPVRGRTAVRFQSRIDQRAPIRRTRRLFATKEFLNDVGSAADRVMLAAFADGSRLSLLLPSRR